MCSPSNGDFIVRYGYILKKNTGIRNRTKYLKVTNGILFIFHTQHLQVVERQNGK